MNRISFQVLGKPVPWARARVDGRRGNLIHFTPKRQKDEKTAIQYAAKRAMGNKPLLTGPLRMAVRFVYPFPKNWSESRRRQPQSYWKTSRPDADNLLKLMKDALNGVVYHDDAQVTFTECRKLHGSVAGTFVTVEQLLPEYEEVDCVSTLDKTGT